jgi:DNA polymerase-3 subunit beta
MKFTCERSLLLKEIAIANEIIASKNAISILSNIYLEAKDGSLVIKATDLKVNFETNVPVDVLEKGSVTVYGEKFYGILNSIPDGEVEFELANGKININTKAKTAKVQLKCIASDNFPEFGVSGKEFFEMPIKNLKEMIRQTIFAISDDETRYFMNGVFFEKSEGKFTMVATDGRRLACIEKPAVKEV